MSLLLVVPAVIGGLLLLLWAASYFACVRVTRAGVHRDACVLVARGNVIYWSTGGAGAEPPFDGRALTHGQWMVQVARVPDPPPRWMMRPLNGVPLWLGALPTIIGPIVWLDRRLAARRALRRGLCPACGYDLRATPDRCPECGAAPRARPEAAV